MGLNSGGGQGSGEGTFVDDLANKLMGWISKLTGAPHLANIQQGSITGPIDKKDGIQDKMVNQGAKGLTSKREGGAIVSGLAKYITRDFSRVDPLIEGLPIGDSKFDFTEIGVASLGAFSSPYTPSSGISYESGIGGVT